MNINDIYQSDSQWLKASDIPPGKEIEVLMSEIGEIDLDGKKKVTIKFQNKEKGLVVNKTNAMNIAHVYGPDTNNWTNKPIRLYSAKVDYAGKQVDAIRVRVVNNEIQDEDIPF